MALAANVDWVINDVDGNRPVSMIVLSAAVIYNGSLCTHDTTTGEIKPFDGTETDRIVGWHFGDKVTGNASGARVRAMIRRGGFIARNLAVTGLANTSADYGATVYASDDGTYTLTATGNVPVGTIIPDDRRSTDRANVYMFPISGGGAAGGLLAAITSLTDNSGGAANDTLADVEATYTEATLANNFADLAAKINAILVALRSAQIIAS